MKNLIKLSAFACLVVAITCVFAGCASVDLQKINEKLTTKEPDFITVVLTDVKDNSALSMNMDSIFSSQIPDYESRAITSALVGHDKYNLKRFVIVAIFEDKDQAKQAKEYIDTNLNGNSIAKLSGSALYIASTENLMKIIK